MYFRREIRSKYESFTFRMNRTLIFHTVGGSAGRPLSRRFTVKLHRIQMSLWKLNVFNSGSKRQHGLILKCLLGYGIVSMVTARLQGCGFKIIHSDGEVLCQETFINGYGRSLQCWCFVTVRAKAALFNTLFTVCNVQYMWIYAHLEFNACKTSQKHWDRGNKSLGKLCEMLRKTIRR